MGHVEKELKLQPSIYQITQRINMYEAEIEKPKNHIFSANTDKHNKKDELGPDLDEEEQKRL